MNRNVENITINHDCSPAGDDDFLTAHRAARLLGINEKKVYVLAREGRIPGTKVTGKWLFPRRELAQLLHRESARTLKRFSTEYALSKSILLVAGSDDPVLAMLQGLLHQEHPDLVLFSASVGSGEGLRLLRERFCHAALSHLYDPDEDEHTFPFIRGLFPDPDQLVVVNLFHRRVGFVSREPVESFGSLVQGSMRFVNRQPGSGIRMRVDRMLADEGIEPGRLSGYEVEEHTHLNVALRVSAGRADAGVASEAVARYAGLLFTPLFEERFDMVVYKDTFFERSVQSLIELIRSPAFSRMLEGMGGYDSRITGSIVYPAGGASPGGSSVEDGQA